LISECGKLPSSRASRANLMRQGLQQKAVVKKEQELRKEVQGSARLNVSHA
jgi:hypothetical protein